MENIKAVIFDLGRVIVQIDPNRPKFAALMHSLNITPSQAFSQFWLTNEVRQHMTGTLSPQEFHNHGVKTFNLTNYTYTQFAEAWCDLFSPTPGMQELFTEIATHHTVGILSDTDPLHWHTIQQMLPWLSPATHPTLSHEVGYLKPHPAMYDAAAKNCNCTKEQCIFIDDVQENVDGARFSGMPAIRFTNVDKLRKDLRGFGIL